MTIKLNPRLASHAANVSKIILICGRLILTIHDKIGISNTIHNIIPSKQNRDISKWENCVIRAISTIT